MALLLVLLVSMRAGAETGPCGDPAALRTKAAIGGLPDADRVCVEQVLPDLEPALKVEYSFALIVDAQRRGDRDAYLALLRTHLSAYHREDTEVAFLLATELFATGQSTDETLHWAKVAMDGRQRWLGNRSNHDRMVKALFDVLVQVSLQRAVDAKRAYAAEPSAERARQADAYQRSSQHWLALSAPCLYAGDCGPYFEVEVEGWAPCDDLEAMARLARAGALTPEHGACLRSAYRRPLEPQKEILGILVTQADRDAAGATWEGLLAWHWNLDEQEDPALALGYADFLGRAGPEMAEARAKWLDVALSGADKLAKDAVNRVYLDRVAVAEARLAAAEPAAREAASARLVAIQAERDAWCASGGNCTR